MNTKYNLVIIDDEEDILNPLAEMIERRFAELNKRIKKNKGENGVFEINLNKYSNVGLAHLGFGRELIDLAIFDLDLEGANGLSIVENIRNVVVNSSDPFGDPYIIIYSANLQNNKYISQIHDIEKKYARKFHGFINKPNETDLVDRVVELITRGLAD